MTEEYGHLGLNRMKTEVSSEKARLVGFPG